MRALRLLALTMTVLTLMVVLVPAGHAETINVGNGTLVVGVALESRGQRDGAEVTTSSTAAPVAHKIFTGCEAGVYHTRCTLDDEAASSEPQPSGSVRYRGNDPYVCTHVHSVLAPKEVAAVDVCVPGRAYPVPYDRCVLLHVEVTNVVITRSERCLLP